MTSDAASSPPAAGSPPPAPKPRTRWTLLLKAARIVAVVWLLKLVVTAGLYGLTRVMDIEKLRITDATRDSVTRAGDGRFVRLRDGWTHYEVAGPDRAPVVVLAAGASVPAYIWQPTFDTLKASGYRVVRYDYFGRGWSDRPKIPLTQEVYVHQLAELLDSLRVTRSITLAGVSYGGTVITSFAAMHPDKVGALVYVDPAIHRPREIPWFIRLHPIGDLVFQWQSRRWAEGQLDDFLHPERFPQWPDLYRPQMRYKGFRRSRLSDAEANAGFDQRPQLVEVGRHPRPVLVVWGRQDRTVPFAFSDSLLAAMPRATFVPIDSAGHLPQWEQPGVTHAALLKFLRAQRANTKLPARTASGPGASAAALVRP